LAQRARILLLAAEGSSNVQIGRLVGVSHLEYSEACMVGERVDRPATFVLTERWRNGKEYVDEYLSLQFYQEYIRNTEQMYAAPRDVVVLKAVS